MEQALTLELDKGLELEMTKENQNIVTEVSNAFSNAVDKGIEQVDIADEYKSLIKSEARKGELKTAGAQAVEAALRIGAKAIGLNNSTFNSAKQILEALRAGDLKKGLSAAIDIGIDFIKVIPADARKLIKSSKDLLLGDSLDSALKDVMVKQKNTIDRLDKKCDKFDEARSKNDEKEMAKQIKSIKTDLDKVMLIENTINRARSTVNQYELMKNKGVIELTPVEQEVCEKMA
ncbi:MAG: hypothetical protein IJ217_00910 [Clostridia bacterium]|nr:hypothetical protein [Clostridia bacterium]